MTIAMMKGFEEAGFVCARAPMSPTNPVRLDWQVNGQVRRFRLWARKKGYDQNRWPKKRHAQQADAEVGDRAGQALWRAAARVPAARDARCRKFKSVVVLANGKTKGITRQPTLAERFDAARAAAPYYAPRLIASIVEAHVNDEHHHIITSLSQYPTLLAGLREMLGLPEPPTTG